MITAFEERYWAYQYWTTGAGVPNGQGWWPDDGTGRYETEEAARRGAAEHSRRYDGLKMRVALIERKLRFSEPFAYEESPDEDL